MNCDSVLYFFAIYLAIFCWNMILFFFASVYSHFLHCPWNLDALLLRSSEFCNRGVWGAVLTWIISLLAPVLSQSDFYVFICLESSNFQLQFEKKPSLLKILTLISCHRFNSGSLLNPSSSFDEIYTPVSWSVYQFCLINIIRTLYMTDIKRCIQILYTDTCTLKRRWPLLIFKSQCQISSSKYPGLHQVKLVSSHS